MEKERTDDLFLLVHSLTRNEKGYFKKFGYKQADKKESIYVQLFDSIEKLTVWDEEVLLKKLKGKIVREQLSHAKSYLYSLILSSLREFHQEKSPKAEIRKLKDEIDILKGKGLFNQAEKILRKAQKLANRQEMFFELPELVGYQYTLYRSSAELEALQRTIADGFSEMEKALSVQQNWVRMNQIAFLIYTDLRSRNILRSENEVGEFKARLEALGFDDLKEPETPFAKVQFFTICGMVANLRNDYEEFKRFTKEGLKVFEANPDLFEFHLAHFITLAKNFQACCFKLRHFQELEKLLEDLKRLPGKEKIRISENDSYDIFLTYHIVGCNYFREIADYQRLKNLMPGLEEGLAKYAFRMNRFDKIYININLAFASFVLDDFSRAQTFVNQILELSDGKTALNYVGAAYLMNLAIHFELGNLEHLSYLARNTKRHFENRPGNHFSEKLLIQALGKLLSAVSRQDKDRVFSELEKETLVLREDPLENQIFFLFNLPAWARSKREGVPYREALLSIRL